ncbi:MAG: DNA polymerase zeta [Chrysothrix sp. TS-e1954]|nr:MAG: DNA polymerase zeta [Chrysothrix sp. TS-e1954]
MDIFRVCLNCVDHYQAQPTGLDPLLFGSHGSTQQRNAPQLPVIRVFGATETGQKVCAHIHGALPYLYVEYHGSLKDEEVESYKQQLRASIDHALAVSYRRNIYDGKSTFVGRITLVKGVPFFGYHVGYRYFLKIYMLNPLNMTRFADLLYQGAIMKKTFQPFEAHLQYLLQWMCDFNLYGCSYIDCSNLRFRSPVPDFLELKSMKHKWHDRSINPDWILDADQYPRQSHCALEVDICVHDILNRKEIETRDVHADFVERFGVFNPEEKLVHSLTGLWKDETKRRKRRVGLSDTSSSPFPPEVLVSMSAEPRNTDKGGWIHEEEYRDMVKDLVTDEQDKSSQENVDFDTFIKAVTQDPNVQTVLESVEDLFPQNLGPDSLMSSANHEVENDLSATVAAVVDEGSIPRFDDHDFPYDSDEDTARHAATTQHKNIADDVSHISKMQEAPSDALELLQKRTEEPVEKSEEHAIDALGDDMVQAAATTKPEEEENSAHSSEALRASQTNTSISNDGIPGEPCQAFPRKRRKLAHADQDAQLEVDGSDNRPGSRHVKFQVDAAAPANQEEEQSSRSSDQVESSTPRSSQMSQTSIKVQDVPSSQSGAFPVVKNPYMRQMNDKVPPTPNSFDQETSHGSQGISKSYKSALTTPVSNGKSGSASTSPLITPESKVRNVEQAVNIMRQYHEAFDEDSSRRLVCFAQAPPTAAEVEETFPSLGLPTIVYPDAYYSEEKDVPERARDYAGREFRLESNTLRFLPRFDPSNVAAGEEQATRQGAEPISAKAKRLRGRKQGRCKTRKFEIAAAPPSWGEVNSWLAEERRIDSERVKKDTHDSIRGERKNIRRRDQLSQIEGPTQKNPHGFKFSQKKTTTSVRHETQYMSTMSLEVHANSRGKLAPSPEEDQVACIFWCLQGDEEDVNTDHGSSGIRVGILALAQDDSVGQRINKEVPVEVEYESTELDLINRLVDIVREFDPDILTGYEVHNGSWGYLIERARIQFEYNLCDELSRMKSQSHGRFGKDADRWGFNHTSTIRVTGRHMINIWRAMRSELNLLQYTMENVVFHLLHKRIPHYTFHDLTTWYTNGVSSDLAKTLEYFLSRVQLNDDILQANELIPRTSEQARLIGVDFFSVFSRGSQFKVESFMFRIAKPENFLLVSPSRKQVGQQNALECLPLVMEPQSAFYNSPLLVLDFQSLYPSIMIAYNYCYSTCLGRIVSWRGQNKMGFADFKRQPRLLELVKDSINIAPNGMMYVKKDMRKSLLAKMLGEILESRVMVKSGMKVDKDDKTLQQLLNNRQLALKLLANVTYGYTSASFSGRMPCSEIADSIVQTGRETLEKAIALIHSVTRWGAEVVYGDTDSLFVYLKGRTREQAFDIGNEIAREVTNLNPRPVKLKFEKVYHPCVLLAKKRYVGFKYESKSQTEPDFDAKGIETVRRDGTPAEQKIEEKALKILFRTADLSQVKSFFLRQCAKIMQGKVSIQDFCFAREVKLGTYADKGPPPPGALISTRRMLEDPRTEPQYGERVPYVVITGAPGARLIDRCIAPEQLLREEGAAELDAEYYISKNLIPPLERIFNLVGANVRQWYDEMPKVQRIRDVAAPFAGEEKPGAYGYLPNGAPAPAPRKTLESYMKSSHCVVCRRKLPPPAKKPFIRGQKPHQRPATATPQPASPLCRACQRDPARSMYALASSLKQAQGKAAELEKVCRSCAGLKWGEEVRCDSKDCNVFYSRVRARVREVGVRRTVEGVGRELQGEWGW